jgi:Immunity protein 72
MGIMHSLFGGAAQPPLKPEGPAPFGQPDEQDRLAMFHWLKRAMSFTFVSYIARQSSVVTTDYEAWLRKQDNPYESQVDVLKYLLDSATYYDKTIDHLKVGDRSIYNGKSSEGYYGKAGYSYCLAARQPEWEGRIEFYDYVAANPDQGGPELAAWMPHYYAVREMIGSDGGREISITHTSFKSQRPFSLLKSLGNLATLPEPVWDISFAPGKRAPKDGIYEEVNAQGHIVGGMKYFIKGEEAEAETWLDFGPGSPGEAASGVVYRLLWEDTRYKDGTIPDEEKLYLFDTAVATASPAPVNYASAASDVLHAHTGETALRGGTWVLQSDLQTRIQIQKGDKLPQHQGQDASWVWSEQS